MDDNERIEKLEKQVTFLTEKLVYTNREILRILNDLKDIYNTINEVSKTSVERDLNLVKAVVTLSCSKEKSES